MAVFTRVQFTNTPAELNSVDAYFTLEENAYKSNLTTKSGQTVYYTEEFINGLNRLGFSYQDNLYTSVRTGVRDSGLHNIETAIPWDSSFSSYRTAGYVNSVEYKEFINQ